MYLGASTLDQDRDSKRTICQTLPQKWVCVFPQIENFCVKRRFKGEEYAFESMSGKFRALLYKHSEGGITKIICEQHLTLQIFILHYY